MADLVKRKNEISEVNKRSLTPQEITLGRELELTRQNAKSEAEPSLMTEFYREFAHLPEPAITWLFREHRRRSAFFPTISEIFGLLCEWRIKERMQREQDAVKAEKLKLQEGRQRGEVIDFGSMRELLQKVTEVAPALTIKQVAKPIPGEPREYPSREELERRRNEQLDAVRAKYGDAK